MNTSNKTVAEIHQHLADYTKLPLESIVIVEPHGNFKGSLFYFELNGIKFVATYYKSLHGDEGHFYLGLKNSPSEIYDSLVFLNQGSNLLDSIKTCFKDFLETTRNNRLEEIDTLIAENAKIAEIEDMLNPWPSTENM